MALGRERQPFDRHGGAAHVAGEPLELRSLLGLDAKAGGRRPIRARLRDRCGDTEDGERQVGSRCTESLSDAKAGLTTDIGGSALLSRVELSAIGSLSAKAPGRGCEVGWGLYSEQGENRGCDIDDMSSVESDVRRDRGAARDREGDVAMIAGIEGRHVVPCPHPDCVERW